MIKGLEEIFKLINTEEKGAIIFINQQQQSENLLARIKELKASDTEKNKVAKAPPLKMDLKDFGIGAQILHELHISKLTRNYQFFTRTSCRNYWLWIRDCRIRQLLEKPQFYRHCCYHDNHGNFNNPFPLINRPTAGPPCPYCTP